MKLSEGWKANIAPFTFSPSKTSLQTQHPHHIFKNPFIPTISVACDDHRERTQKTSSEIWEWWNNTTPRWMVVKLTTI